MRNLMTRGMYVSLWWGICRSSLFFYMNLVQVYFCCKKLIRPQSEVAGLIDNIYWALYAGSRRPNLARLVHLNQLLKYTYRTISLGKYLKLNMNYKGLGELSLNPFLFADYIFQATSIAYARAHQRNVE